MSASLPKPDRADGFHPRFGSITPDAIRAQLPAAIAAHREAIEAICASDDRDFKGVLLAREAAELELAHWWSPIAHLSRVADSPALRKAHADAEAMLSDHWLWVGQNESLYQATEASGPSGDVAGWGSDQVRVRSLALRDFKLRGVALAPAERDRYRRIATELTALSTAFSNAVLDSTDAFHLDLPSRAGLAGIPQADVDRFRATAAAAGRPGYRIGLQAPDVQAVLTHARSRRLRHIIYRAYATRASDQGPDAGRFDNGGRIERIMALRQEAARLLGFGTSADHSLAIKMAPGAGAVEKFLLDLAARARPAALEEFELLRQFAEGIGIKRVRPWDVAFVSDQLRRDRFALDSEEVRAFFPADAVIDGTMGVLGELFAIRFERRNDVPLWHGEAAYYDIVDACGQPRGGIYLDLFARAGKRGGAWMDVCRQRFVGDGPTRLPVAFLTCNFAPPQGAATATLRHGDVVTFLHEFGHVLHHVLTEVDYPSIGGINGVEWDAVELPSQLMENFAWDYPALKRLSRHVVTGETLPADLFERLSAARTFQSGMRLCRQIEMALFDLRFHHGSDGGALAVLARTRREVSVLDAPRWDRFPHGFSHIFAGGYAAGYYSYLWAELLAADAFGRFREAGGICGATGAAFREEILARGASRTAAENFAAFRGREPDPAALLSHYGLAA